MDKEKNNVENTIEQTKKIDIGSSSSQIEKTILLTPDMIPGKQKPAVKEQTVTPVHTAQSAPQIPVVKQKTKSKSAVGKIIFLILLIVALVGVYFAGITMLTKKWFTDAETLRVNKNYDTAIANYKRIITFKSDYPKVHKGLGLVYFEKKYYDGALEELKKELKFDQKDSEVYYFTAKIMFLKKDFDNAIINYKSSLQLQPKFISAAVELADAYYQKKQIDEAINMLQQVEQIDPNYPDLFTKMGYCYMDKEADIDAIDSFNKAISKNPNSIEIHYILSDLYLRTSKYSEAISELLKLRALDSKNFETTYKPNLAAAYYNYALSIAKNDKKKALLNLEQSIKLDKEFAKKAKQEKVFKIYKADKKFINITK